MKRTRPIASVHVDLARLQHEYSQVSLAVLLSADSKDSMESAEKLMRARAAWIDDLVNSLVLRDPSLSGYGAHLLAEVEEYRKADSARKKGNHDSEDSMDSTESEDSQPRADRADRSGKNTGSRPGRGSGSHGGKRTRGQA